LEIQDRFSSTLKLASDKLSLTAQRLEDMSRAAGSAALALAPVSLAASSAGAAVFKFGKDFETTMSRVETLAGVSAATVRQFERQIIEMAGQLGRTPQELAEGMLVITSAGMRGAEALDVLRVSAQASATGLGDTKAIASAITSAVMAYGEANLSAAQAADVLFATVREGKAEAAEVAPVLGRVVGIASQVGVTFDQVGAFIATFTRLGVDAAEAVTALRGVLSTVLKPTKDAVEALREGGTTIEALRGAIRERGLTAALNELVDRFRGNEDQLARVIPNVRALAGVLGTAGAQAHNFAQIQQTLSDAMRDGTIVTSAFARSQSDADAALNRMTATVQAMAVRLFQAWREEVALLLSKGESLIAWLDGVTRSAEALGAPGRNLLQLFGGLLALAAPLAGALAGIGLLAGPIATGFARVAGALSLLSAGLALLESPVIAVAVGIGALALAVASLWPEIEKLDRTLSKSRIYGFASALLAGVAPMQAAVFKLRQEVETELPKVADAVDGFTQRALKAGQSLNLLTPQMFRPDQTAVIPGVSLDDLLAETADQAGRAAGQIGKLSDEIKELRDKILGLDVAAEMNNLVAVWRSLSAAQRENPDIVERVLEAYVQLRDEAITPLPAELERVLDAWFALDDAVRGHQQTLDDAHSSIVEFGSMINRGIIEPGKRLVDQQRELKEELGEWLFVTPRLIQNIVDANDKAAKEATENIRGTREWGLELGWLTDAFEQLAQVADGALSHVVRVIGTVIAAMQMARQAGLELKKALSSGDWKDAISAGIGGVAGVLQATSQGNAATRAIGGAAAGAQFGAAFGLVGMGVGAVAGGLVGLFRGLFGPSEGRKRLLEANKQIEDLRQSLLHTYGTLDEIRKLGGALGVDLAGMWGSQNVQGLRGFTAAAEEFAKKLEAVRAEMQRIAETGAVASVELVKFRDAMRDTPEVRDFIRGQVEIVGESVKAFLDNAKILTQGGADAIAQMLLLAWDGTTQGLAALMPVIEQYRQQLEAAGLQSSKAFGFFREMAALAADEVRGPLLQGINAGTDALVAMFNAGFLTQETFEGMVGEIMAQRQALIDSGAAADVVNAAMQKDLQRIWELTHLHGMQVDETTQALLDEAEASGLIGKQFVNATDRMVAGIERLVELFEAAFGDKLPNAVRDGAQQAVDELHRLLPDEIPIRVRYTVEGDGGRGEGGEGPSRQHGSPGTVFEHWGGGTMAMLHGDEAVVTRRQGESLAAMLEQAVLRAGAGVGREIVIPIRLEADAVRLAEVVARHHPRAVGLRGG
jgi:TP901 family phage tail tape measure protein